MNNFYQRNCEKQVLGIFQCAIDQIGGVIIPQNPLGAGASHKNVVNAENEKTNETDEERKNVTDEIIGDVLVKKRNEFSIITDFPYGLRTPIQQSTMECLIQNLYDLTIKLNCQRICFCTITGFEEFIEKTFSSKSSDLIEIRQICRIYQKLKGFHRVFYCFEIKRID